MSYKDTGLDEYGMPIDSPITAGTVSESAYEYSSTNERSAVTNYNLQNFSFGKGQGGTITLGGTVNGNGYFQIKNAAGSVIVTGDNTGLTVTSGSITVNSSNGTTVIDSLGLNSGNNFYSDMATGGAFNTTSATPVNVTSGTLSTLVLSRATKCFVYVAINGQNYHFTIDSGGADSRAYVYDTYLGGTIPNYVANFSGIASSSLAANQLVFLGRILNMAAGTHTLNLQVLCDPDGTTHLAGWEIGLLKLGN